MADDPYERLPIWDMPPAKKLVRLGLKAKKNRVVIYQNGEVLELAPNASPRVIATPGIMCEPDTTYFFDGDGDLACKLAGGGPPPMTLARELTSAPMSAFADDPILATVRFYEMPFSAGPSVFESELLEPARALEAWLAASVRHPMSGFCATDLHVTPRRQ
jgi:hypothetical protein